MGFFKSMKAVKDTFKSIVEVGKLSAEAYEKMEAYIKEVETRGLEEDILRQEDRTVLKAHRIAKEEHDHNYEIHKDSDEQIACGERYEAALVECMKTFQTNPNLDFDFRAKCQAVIEELDAANDKVNTGLEDALVNMFDSEEEKEVARDIVRQSMTEGEESEG